MALDQEKALRVASFLAGVAPVALLPLLLVLDLLELMLVLLVEFFLELNHLPE